LKYNAAFEETDFFGGELFDYKELCEDEDVLIKVGGCCCSIGATVII